MRRLHFLLPALLWITAPAGAGAQLRPPDIGQALREMDRERARRDLSQTFVLPERPGQNLVAWYDFEWLHYDIPSPSGGKGGVRLYYYRREAPVAEKALPVIRSTYLRLVDQFHYTPTRQIPYFLYSSKREFQTTNLFQIGESTLGVTSPADLKMSLPYFGDHDLFRHVAAHEMVHQFTIQKLLDIAGAQELSFIQSLPLWFIEGIAEYYSLGGMDVETDAFLRDLVWNPDPEKHWEVLAFQEDRIRGFIPTYKMGQARVAFIADTYGKEKIQALIENAYQRGGEASASARPIGGGFAALVRRVLNEAPEQVDARWRAWLKRRYYSDYLKARQDLPQVHEYAGLPVEPEDFAASPDGEVVFFRGIDRERGRASLYLFDARNPRGAVRVAGDNQPGVETLHPLQQGVVAIGERELAFVAQDGSGDSLYLVPYGREPAKGRRPAGVSLGKRREIELRHPSGQRFIELGDPAFSPDGKSIAFAGLTDLGQRDVYVAPVGGGTARQLTDDGFSERELAWGKDGIVFASDATDHGRSNLFRVDPASGALTRLTTEPASHRHPQPQADGSVLFSSDASGKSDLYRLADGKVGRLSDFATGLSRPQLAPGGRGIYAASFYRGRFRLLELPKVAWLEDGPAPVQAPAGPVLSIPVEDIPDDANQRYSPYSLRSWRPEGGYVFGGGGGNVIGVQAAGLFADLFRDRQLYLELAVLGSFDYTQALVLYEDRHRRTSWAWGAYHFVNQQIDRHDFSLAFFQRDFGGAAILRYPLDRYQRLELELTAGGVQRYCLTDYSVDLPAFCGGLRHTPLPGVAADWDRANGGVNPILGPTVRYGYDTVRFDPFTGPIDGSSLLLELGGSWLPTRSAVNGFARLDAAHWFRIVGRSNFMLRAAAGSSFAPDSRGVNWARAWWVSAADNLRGFYPLDTQYLIGLHYYVANAELQVPLDVIVKFFLFDLIEGVAAVDFGGVANQLHNKTFTFADGSAGVAPGLWEARTLTGVLGFNVLFGPFLLRVHFGHPFDIGGVKTPAQLSGTNWVTNVTLRLLFF